MFKNAAQISLVLLLSLLIAACATSLDKRINKIKPGMNKSTVVESLGSPRRTSRSNSVDHWDYEYFVKNEEKLTEIKFYEGEVIGIKTSPKHTGLLFYIKNTKNLDEYEEAVKNYLDERIESSSTF